MVSWLALIFVAMLPMRYLDLPLNAQPGDLVFPFLAVAVRASTRPQRWISAGDWPLAAYLAITLICSMVSPGPALGLALFAKQIYGAALFVVFRVVAKDAQLTPKLQRTLVVVTGLITVAAIAVIFHGTNEDAARSVFSQLQRMPFVGVVRRIRGLSATPELFGNLLVVCAVHALALRVTASGHARVMWTLIVAILGVGEFVTYSHSAAGFAAAIALFVAGLTASRPLKAGTALAALAIVAMVNAASVVVPVRNGEPTHYEIERVSLDVAGHKMEGALMSYAALKRVAWSSVVDHPLIGVGPGRFVALSEAAVQEGRLTKSYRGSLPHCDIAGRSAETGLVGVVSLILLWASWLRAGRRSWSTGSVSQRAAVAVVLGLLVNSLNADVMNFRFLWLVLAWMWPQAGESAPASPLAERARG